jgi:hypothetical protein
MMWALLLKKGSWREPKNIIFGVINLIVFLIGIVTLVAGTYASIDDIVSVIQAVLDLKCFRMRLI